MESHVFCLFNKRYSLGSYPCKDVLENPLVDCLEENCSALPESSLSQMEGYSLLLNEIPSYFFTRCLVFYLLFNIFSEGLIFSGLCFPYTNIRLLQQGTTFNIGCCRGTKLSHASSFLLSWESYKLTLAEFQFCVYAIEYCYGIRNKYIAIL